MKIKLPKETENMLQQIEDKKTRNGYRGFLKTELENQSISRERLEEQRIKLEELNKKQLDHDEIIKEAIRNHEGAKQLVRRGIKHEKEWIEEHEERYRKYISWMKEKIDNGEQHIFRYWENKIIFFDH